MTDRAIEARTGRWARVAPLVLIWVYAAFVYFPITRTFFHHDDFVHLYDIANNPALRFILKMNAFHLLLIPETIFWLTHAAAGTNPAPYMWTELLVHLLNCALLFAIAQTLLQRRWLAAVVVIAWATMLLQEGALNAYSVFEQTICVTFVLLAVLRILRSASSPSLSWGAAATAGLCTLAASCSFGTGLAAAAAMPVVAVLLVPPSEARRRLVICLVGVLPLIAVLYFAVESYNVTAFGASRAVAVAPRDLSALLRVVAFVWHLLAIGIFALGADGLFRPDQYPGVFSALVLIAAAVIVVIGLRDTSTTQRRAFLAMLLLTLAAYGMIAAGRMFIPLPLRDMALWPRYHYTATAGLVLAIGIPLATVVQRLADYAMLRRALLIGWLVTVAVAHQFTPRIENYDVFRRSVGAAVASMHSLAVAAPPGTVVELDNTRFGTGNMLPEMKILFPGWFAVHAVFVGGEQIAGRPVRFIEPDASIRTPARSGTLGAKLVISPEEAQRAKKPRPPS